MLKSCYFVCIRKKRHEVINVKNKTLLYLNDFYLHSGCLADTAIEMFIAKLIKL